LLVGWVGGNADVLWKTGNVTDYDEQWTGIGQSFSNRIGTADSNRIECESFSGPYIIDIMQHLVYKCRNATKQET